MSIEDEVRVVRRSVGVARASELAVIEVTGAGARDLVHLAATQPAHRRDGRARQALLLRDDGTVLSDVLVCSLQGGFLLLAEGPAEGELVAWLSSLRERLPEVDVTIRGGRGSRSVFSVDGPYAWELITGLMGAAVLGMPYLSVLSRGDLQCVRAGKTGEYGYYLIVPSDEASTIGARLAELGEPLGAALVTRDALDLCALEAGHFSVGFLPDDRRLTPIELQLQWRVGYAREFVGADALRACRDQGPAERITWFLADGSVAAGDAVCLGDRELGRVLTAARSPTLGRAVGWALLERRFAHPHLDLTAQKPAGDSLAIRTCSAFLFATESLRVQPHLGHTYANRGERT